jgi:hypothetical protein
MMYFHTKNPNIDIFWKALERKILVNYLGIWCILRDFGIFKGKLVYFVVFLYIFHHFGMTQQEKSGKSGYRSSNFFSIGRITRSN